MVKKTKTTNAIIFGIIFFFTVVIEIVLRSYFGFCDMVLFEENTDYEYIAKPSQKRERQGKNIFYNSKSMRGSEIDSTAEIVLGFGDSVLNGGEETDHDSLATTIVSGQLTNTLNKNVQVLNISIGGWGPDNCFAYLKKHGNFKAKQIFLFVNSHDAYDNMGFEKVIDVNKNFQSKQYVLGIFELFDKDIWPRIRHKLKSSEKPISFRKDMKQKNFNSGFKSFVDYSKEKEIPLTIFLHAEQTELNAGKYNSQGQEIIQFAKKHQIPLIKDIDKGLELTDFRDYIHLNEQGQKKLSTIITEVYNERNVQ